MQESMPSGIITLDEQQLPFESVFTVAPLFIVGTKEADGSYNLAPKHMAGPLGWEDRFGFICTPQQTTYANLEREKVFTVSYPLPTQVILASLAASPRTGEGGAKPALRAIPTFAATRVDGVLVQDAYLLLECELDRFVESLGCNTLAIGRIVAAHAREEALRSLDRDDQEIIYRLPLLAYLYPGRYATVGATNSFPFPEGMKR